MQVGGYVVRQYEGRFHAGVSESRWSHGSHFPAREITRSAPGFPEEHAPTCSNPNLNENVDSRDS
jgi:hypothetical protein